MKPFVKWAGGKKQILPQILDKIKEQIPSFAKNDYMYIEPFVGGGIVFITLKNPNSIINDLNKFFTNRAQRYNKCLLVAL